MGKVTPPADVFNTWSPEAQKGYNCRLDSMAGQRDVHRASAANHQQKSDERYHAKQSYQDTLNYDGARHTSESNFAADSGQLGLVMIAETEAIEEKKLADEENNHAEVIDREIKRLTIEEARPNTDVEESKRMFREDALKNMDADRDKLYEKKQELYKLEQELEDTWFFGKDALKKQIAILKMQIDVIEDDLRFNQQNLDNTFPPPPSPPDPPSAPGIPPVQTFVSSGAKLSCPLAIPCGATLVVDPSRLVFLEGPQMANIMDFKPLVNIPTMGQCNTMSNPAVAAATAAKLGVFTPAPCVPALAAPWKPGDSTVLVENFPALLSTDTLQCMWGGVITILPG